MNTARGEGSGGGTQTAAITYGGRQTGPGSGTTATETYDGTTWSTSPATLATACAFCIMGTTGTQTAAINATGSTGPGGGTPLMTTAQEFNFGINTITAAAWASGGGLTTGRKAAGTAGSQSAGMIFGGSTGPDNACIANTEQYNGSTWSEVGDLNTARGMMLGGCGTQTAGLAFGGVVNGQPNAGTADSEEFDGSSWSEGDNLGTARSKLAGFGTQTAALGAGGYSSPPETTWGRTEEYNGSSWSEQTDMSTARRYLMGFGTQTAGLVAGGYTSTAIQDVAEEYNGSSWTTGGAMLITLGTAGSAGSTNAAGLVFGGVNPSGNLTTTQGYDGTAWSTRPSMASARKLTSGTGTNTAALCMGGQNPPSTQNLQTVEEFTGATETATASTLTTS